MATADDQEQNLFREALRRANGPERDAFLDQACARNAALRARLAALLAAHERPDSFLEPPVAALPTTAPIESAPLEGPGTPGPGDAWLPRSAITKSSMQPPSRPTARARPAFPEMVQ